MQLFINHCIYWFTKICLQRRLVIDVICRSVQWREGPFKCVQKSTTILHTRWLREKPNAFVRLIVSHREINQNARIFRVNWHAHTDWPCWLRMGGRASSLTKMRIRQGPISGIYIINICWVGNIYHHEITVLVAANDSQKFVNSLHFTHPYPLCFCLVAVQAYWPVSKLTA